MAESGLGCYGLKLVVGGPQAELGLVEAHEDHLLRDGASALGPENGLQRGRMHPDGAGHVPGAEGGGEVLHDVGERRPHGGVVGGHRVGGVPYRDAERRDEQ